MYIKSPCEFELHHVQGEWYYLSDEHELFIKNTMSTYSKTGIFMGKDGLEFAHDTVEDFISPLAERSSHWSAFQSTMSAEFSGAPNQKPANTYTNCHGKDTVTSHSFSELAIDAELSKKIGVIKSTNTSTATNNFQVYNPTNINIKKVNATVTNAVHNEIDELRSNISTTRPEISIDGEWVVSYTKGPQPKMAVLSMAYEDKSGIIQTRVFTSMHLLNSLPLKMKELLLDENVVLVGHYVHVDICKIGRDFGLKDKM